MIAMKVIEICLNQKQNSHWQMGEHHSCTSLWFKCRKPIEILKRLIDASKENELKKKVLRNTLGKTEIWEVFFKKNMTLYYHVTKIKWSTVVLLCYYKIFFEK